MTDFLLKVSQERAIENVKTYASKFLTAYLLASDLGLTNDEISGAAIDQISADAMEYAKQEGIPPEKAQFDLKTILELFNQPQQRARGGRGRPPGSRNKSKTEGKI